MIMRLVVTQLVLSPARGPQARLPEIEELQRQITASCEELADLDFKATEERAAAASREATLKVCWLRPPCISEKACAAHGGKC